MGDHKRRKLEVDQIAVVAAEISPQEFFEQFVVSRVPAKFSNIINDSNWKGSEWTNEALQEKSGDAVLRVESRSSSTESFGRGNEAKMTFSTFLDSLEGETETSYYLTTQELSYTHEGQPSLTSPPVDGLIGGFPWVPKLCGNLIPQNISMWFGSSKLPTSSGLHHDFHDNLYILLRGEKRITLFSPEDAHNMYTVGEIEKVHPNGRINYKGQPTNADGSDEASLIALKASTDLDLAADSLQSAEEANEDADIELAEKRIEDALEALLDAEIAGNEEDSEEDSDSNDEDGGDNDGDTGYESLNLLRKLGGNNDEKDENDDDDEDDDNDFLGADDYMDSDDEAAAAEIAAVAASTAVNAKNVGDKSTSSSSSSGKKMNSNSKDQDTDGDVEISVTNASAHAFAGVSTSIKSPPNFSKVVTSLPLAELKIEFPLYHEVITNSRYVTIGDDRSNKINSSGSLKINQGRSRSLEVTIKAGEMLYIPCGWFHEVRSTGGGKDGHLAFNYWFHPPDGNSFEKPYKSDFWPSDWRKRNLK